MSETNGNGIHLVRVQAESLHRLRFAQVELDPEGQLVKVTGKNGAGKSSLLRVIREGLGGAGEVLPEAINDESEDGTGSLRLELSNGYTIQRRFTESNPKGYLTVVGPDGGKHGQGRINEWLGRNHTFDVLSIFELKAERLTEILLGLAADPDLKEKLDAVRARYTELYEERTPHISEQRRCRAVPKPDRERPDPVDVSGEMGRLRELQAKQRERGDLVRRANRLHEEADQAKRREKEAAEHVQELERQLARAREDLELRKRETKIATTASQEALEEVEETPDPSADIEAVQARISEADAVNASMKPWERYDEAQEALEHHRAERDRYNEALAEVEAKKREALAAADLPFTELSIGDDGQVLLGGVALSAASGMERCRLALEVAIADDPDLGVVFMNGNELDDEALAEIHRMAEEHDFQVVMDLIHSPGFEGEVRMDDGVAYQEGVEVGADA